MNIQEMDFEYSEWDESKYIPSELNVTGSMIAFGGGGSPTDSDECGFKVKITYALYNNDELIFSFSGIKCFLFEKKFNSIHLLSFLAEVAINEFDEEFNRRKPTSRVNRQRFFKRTIDQLSDDLIEAVISVHSGSSTTH